jgi:hypothetical protein
MAQEHLALFSSPAPRESQAGIPLLNPKNPSGDVAGKWAWMEPVRFRIVCELKLNRDWLGTPTMFSSPHVSSRLSRRDRSEKMLVELLDIFLFCASTRNSCTPTFPIYIFK